MAGVVLLWPALSATREVVRHDWGPFYAQWVDVRGDERIRFLGPVGDIRDNDRGDTVRAARPFYHSWYQKQGDFRRTESLWPIFVRRTREEQSYVRFLLNFYWNWDMKDPQSPWRLWLMPFYFQGRDHQGEPWVALFPIVGSLHEFFFWDEINFALFPLWVESRINDLRTESWLWPVFSRTEGPGVERFRIFPFYGYNEREGRGRKTFVLWPIWTHVRYTLPGASGTGWILFPLTGHLELEDQESWWVLPPLFRVAVGEEQNRIFGPWPIFQKEEGEVDKFYLLPFYGHKRHAGNEKWLFLWPLGQAERAVRPLETKERLWFFPFLQVFNEIPSDAYADESEKGRQSYLKLWPLFQRITEHDGQVRRLAVFDLNPMRGGPVERNYAPFWQVYTRSESFGNVDTEVLWGLYRSSARGDHYRYRSLFPVFSWSREETGGHFSLLKGLLSRKRSEEQIRWRVLYLFTFGDKESEE